MKVQWSLSLFQDRASTDIFSAHDDAGRVTRVLNPEPLWTSLSSTSADYRALERESGVQLFNECGFIRVLRDGDDYIERMKRTAKKFGVVAEVLGTTEARRTFRQINFRPGDVAVFTRTDSGLINPRKLIKAQKILAQRNGCTVISDVVDSIIPAPPNGDLQQVTTGQGRLYHGRRVLLATGAFTECRNLLPPDLYPEVFNSKQTCVLIEISEDDASILHSLPSFAIDRHYDGIEYHFYVLPPVRYPDGKLYCKFGHGEDAPVEASTPQEIRDWYRCRGSPDMARHLIRAFHDILPGVSAVNYIMDSCVTTKTEHHQPYIDMVRPGVGVVIGGCGRGAKASDRIGYIAARMILKGSWDHGLPKEEFQYKVKKKGKKWTFSKL